MAKFCTECGKEIAEGIAFCTECGTKAPTDPVPQMTEPVTEVKTELKIENKPEVPVYTTPAPTYQSQQTYNQPVQTAYAPPAPDPTNKVVGTGTYFGLMLLFSLPVIGLIACLVMAFVPKNKNLKNYARAMLIWTIIALVIAGLLALLISFLLNSVTDLINQTLGENFGGIGEVFNQFNEGGDPTGGIGNSDVSGDGGGGLGDLFSQFKEFGEQMEQFENGGLSDLPFE